MNKRNCPVCETNKAEVIMTFTPELLCAVNPTYKVEELRKAIIGKDDLVTYSECDVCGMVYCETLWDNDTLRIVYDKTIDHEKSLEKVLLLNKRIAITRTWNNLLRLFTLLGKKKLNDIKLLDYGCGWGDFLDVANGYGVNVYGYDEDKRKIDFAKKRGHKIVDSIEELKSLSPVDVFVMNSVLEHVQDVDYILKLVKTLLKPNGLLIFSVNDYRSKYIKKNVKKVSSNFPALSKNFNPLEHVNIYDYKSVMTTLEKYNFEFISTRLSLDFTNIPGIRNSIFFLKCTNKLEKAFSNILTGKEIGITVYAKNNATN